MFVSFCAIQWASGLCRSPWALANAVEEVTDLGKALDVSLYHVKRKSNSEVNHTVK